MGIIEKEVVPMKGGKMHDLRGPWLLVGAVAVLFLLSGCVEWWEGTPADPGVPCPGQVPCKDKPPVVVVTVDCDGRDRLCVNATGSYDADECGDGTITEMVITAVPGSEVWRGTELAVSIPRPQGAQSIIVMVRDDEGGANSKAYQLPQCSLDPCIPCLPDTDLLPQPYTVISYDCARNEITVDSSASRDGDDLGSQVITWMQVEMESGQTISGANLIVSLTVPQGVSEGKIKVTIRDNEGNEVTETARFIIVDGNATFTQIES